MKNLNDIKGVPKKGQGSSKQKQSEKVTLFVMKATFTMISIAKKG